MVQLTLHPLFSSKLVDMVKQDDLCEIQEYLRIIHYTAVTIQKICRPFMAEKACMDGQLLNISQPDKSVGAETER